MYDFIVKNLKHGHWVAVKDKFNDWRVFMYLRPDGKIECTVPEDTIEESLKIGLSSTGYKKNNIENNFTEEYKIVTPAHVLLEPGTKVEILENFMEIAKKKFDDGLWDKKILDMIGQKGFEIKSITNIDNYCVYSKDKSDWWYFPHWAVAPIHEPENKIELSDDELIAHLEKRGRLKDKKVIE